ncbi:MAG: FecR family protein [Bacteroidota bacterium]
MDKYLTFEIEDFVADEQFCRWILYPEGEEGKVFERLLESYPEKAPLLAEARRLLEGLKVTEEEVKPSQISNLWARIEGSIADQQASIRPLQAEQSPESLETKEGNPKVVPFWNPARIALGIAAALALIVAIYLGTRPSDLIQYANANGAPAMKVELPDGSTAFLNAASTLAYSRSEWENGSRDLKIEGEVQFSVVKNKGTFSVQSPKGTVTVLGTEFNVFDRKDKLEVKCFTGKVKVEREGMDEKILLPKKKTNFHLGDSELKIEELSFESEVERAWTEGIFSYDNVPVLEVFEEVARQYGLELEMKVDPGKNTFQGYFERNSLEKTKESLDFALKNDFKITFETNKLIVE